MNSRTELYSVAKVETYFSKPRALVLRTNLFKNKIKSNAAFPNTKVKDYVFIDGLSCSVKNCFIEQKN